jgi:hypothetical protein
MGGTQREKILILAKTYPSPSAKHIETSCVAGINEDGTMRRLYPVPFRLIEENKQFKKWQWIEVRVEKSSKDHRPESHKIYVDDIVCGDIIPTKNEWSERRKWLDKIPAFDSFAALEQASENQDISLALLRPERILDLEVTKARNPDWTEEERNKLVHQQMQDDIFTEDQAIRQIKQLRKIPYDFHYRYVSSNAEGETERRHKIVDWEAGQLYWNCYAKHGPRWETPFRNKLINDLGGKDLMFLMGNQHRFQDQWLIISLIYPSKRTLPEVIQFDLF